MDKIRKNISSILIGFSTVILAGVAIFTAYRLYQLRTNPVAPNVPGSFPKAEEQNIVSCTELTFSLTQESPTPTVSTVPSPTPTGTIIPSSTPTSTLTPSPTLTPTASTTPTGTLSPSQTPTNTPVATNTPQGPTSTPNPSASPSPTQGLLAQATPTGSGTTLPDAGTSVPSIIMVFVGALLIIITFTLAV